MVGRVAHAKSSDPATPQNLERALYKQTIVVSAVTHDTFPARFLNIFVDYPLGQMRVGDKLGTNWNKAPLKLWQPQLNFAVFCA